MAYLIALFISFSFSLNIFANTIAIRETKNSDGSFSSFEIRKENCKFNIYFNGLFYSNLDGEIGEKIATSIEKIKLGNIKEERAQSHEHFEEITYIIKKQSGDEFVIFAREKRSDGNYILSYEELDIHILKNTINIILS